MPTITHLDRGESPIVFTDILPGKNARFNDNDPTNPQIIDVECIDEHTGSLITREDKRTGDSLETVSLAPGETYKRQITTAFGVGTLVIQHTIAIR